MLLIAGRRRFPLSNVSYLLIMVWLTLHTVAAHYTYANVPAGLWLDQWFGFERNHFDRIVHFSFGLLLTWPLAEVFHRRCGIGRRLLPFMAIITVLGLSAFWEMIEAWASQLSHPAFEQLLIGHQGDIWDAQRDMAAAFYGSLLCIVILAAAGKLRDPNGHRSAPQSFPSDIDPPTIVEANGGRA